MAFKIVNCWSNLLFLYECVVGRLSCWHCFWIYINVTLYPEDFLNYWKVWLADTAADSVLRVGRQLYCWGKPSNQKKLYFRFPMAFLIFTVLGEYCFYRMVKERLGLPKDQTIVFNVHRFVANWVASLKCVLPAGRTKQRVELIARTWTSWLCNSSGAEEILCRICKAAFGRPDLCGLSFAEFRCNKSSNPLCRFNYSRYWCKHCCVGNRIKI